MIGRYWIPLVLVVAACSSKTDVVSTPHTFHVESTASQVNAINSGSPKYNEPLFTTELLYRVTESESTPDIFLIGPLVTPFLGESGQLFVLDHGRVAVAAFDPTGKFLRWMGGRGNGPGEFMQPWIQRVENGVISIYDRIQHRVSEYSYEGQYIGGYKLQFPSAHEYELHRMQAGNLISIQRQQKTEDGYIWEQRRAIAYTVNEDTLWHVESDWLQVGAAVIYAYFGASPLYSRSDLSLAATPSIYYDTDRGIFMVRDASPHIQLYSPSGELRLDIVLDEESIDPELQRFVWNEAEKRAKRVARDHRTDSRGREQTPEITLEWRDFLAVANKPGWSSGLQLDDKGWIWVAYPFFSGVLEWGEGVRYRILSREGEYLGDVYLPALTGCIRYGRFATIERDSETGAWIPAVYKLRPNQISLDQPNR